VRKLTPTTGTLATVAGGGSSGLGLGSAHELDGLAADADGNLFIADQSNGRVVEITPSGVTSTVVAGLNNPTGLAIDAQGNLVISGPDDNLVVGPNGAIAGDSFIGGQAGYSGDGGQAIESLLSQPLGLTFDAQGNLFIADSQNAAVREVSPDG